MHKLLGILPYLYFEDAVKLGTVTFLGLPDWRGRDHRPTRDCDRQHLKKLSTCFRTTRGLSTRDGAVKALTYFLLNTEDGKEAQVLQEARSAITLLRYAMLRPDTHALDNVESTYLYAFALPPAGSQEYHLYQCWPNLDVDKEIWVSPQHQEFPLPGWYVDLQSVRSSHLEDIQEIEQCFYGEEGLAARDDVLLAMEWYSQSFLKYTLRGIAGRLVDLATAFETLFQLPRHNKGAEFRKRVRECLGAEEGSVLDKWAIDFYSNVRSETLHKGRPTSYLFRHPEAQTPHLSFLSSSQRILRECISARVGLPRHTDNDRLTDELVPNEIHLTRLREAGTIQEVLETHLLDEIMKLTPVYPAGKREDIVWLGKELLRYYNERYSPQQQSLPTIELILDSDDADPDLGLKYHRFLEEFRHIYLDRYVAVRSGELGDELVGELQPVSQGNLKQVQLEAAIHHFASFAGWALLLPP